MAVHCPECAFVNPAGANYCLKCGAYLIAAESEGSPSTASWRVGETGEFEPVNLEEEVIEHGAALVIRFGGGREGESFVVEGPRTTIGRDPDSDVFLDDVTVSRDHAVVVERAESHAIDDSGSLNGTYVNRQRIDSTPLSDGDEIQIGKYKLTYLSR